MKAKEWINKILSLDAYERIGIDWEAVSDINDIIEKAIPKKPVYVSGCEDEPLCPNCRDILDGTEEHCGLCDQRLDWSEW